MTDHITIDRKVVEQVLEALGYGYDSARCAAAFDTIHNAETALRAALDAAKTVEPVAEVVSAGGVLHLPKLQWKSANHSLETPIGSQLYTAPPPAISDGWVLVPVEPTSTQVRAGQLGVTTTCAVAIYKAMLATAPTQEEI